MLGAWEKTKNKIAGFTLGIRGLLATSKPIATYVYDSREVLTYHRDGRRCKYPKNYNKIVESGKIIPQRDKDGEPKKDKKGNILLKLLYGPKDKNGEQPSFNLALVKEARNRSYFTIEFSDPIKNLNEDFFKSFGSTVLGFPKREDLMEYAPIFEVDTSFRLANPSVSCKIEEAKDNDGKSIKDQDGNLKYILSYEEVVKGKEEKKEVKFDLVLVKKGGNKSYFTTDFLLNPEGDNNSKYYDLFKSSIVSLEGRSVFEVDTCQLTNSSVLGKKDCKLNDKGEFNEEDRDPKGRNGKLLFTTYYGKPSNDLPKNETEAEVKAKFNAKTKTHFFVIKDQNNNIEWDKSLISVPIVLVSGLAKVFANWLTVIPMKLGEFLIGRKNPIAKAFGYPLFTAGAIVKHSVNILSTILKAPILLFVANEKKYGDKYNTKLWHQLIGHWDELKSDFDVIKDGKRKPEQEETRPNLEFTGTWDELNNIKPGIKKDLEERKNSKKASATLSKSHGAETLKLQDKSVQPPEKKADQTLRLSNKVAKELKAAVSKEEMQALRGALPTQASTKHTNGLQSRRNSQTSRRGCIIS